MLQSKRFQHVHRYVVVSLKTMNQAQTEDSIPMLLDEDVEQKNEYSNGITNQNESDNADEDDDEDDNYDDSDDDDMFTEPAKCLFCADELRNVAEAITHINTVHGIDLSALKEKFNMDQYSFIKLVNYIRSHNVEADAVRSATEIFWGDEKYLKPQAYEPWLTFDYEEDLEQSGKEKCKSASLNEVEKLKLEISKLREDVKQKTQVIDDSIQFITKMRTVYQRLIEKEPTPSQNKLAKHSKSITNLDESYFTGYGSFAIHHEMLSDSVRTISYRDAFYMNKDIVSGKDVLDVGCGTGILSIFASKAGAQQIVGIDNSEIIYNAQDVIRLNDIGNIALVKGRLEDTELPQKLYDIIVSEWMGYFLLFEGMLDTVIYARDNHLKKGGLLLPNRCTLNIMGCGSEKFYNKYVNFWDDVYGVKMTNLRKEMLHDPLICIVEPTDIITESCEIVNLNLYEVDLNYSNFSYNFNLLCFKNGTLYAIVGYFDSYFELPEPIILKTSPINEPTHWKQTVFLLEHPIEVHSGDTISGKIICRRSRLCDRSLDIIIEVGNNKQTYYLQ